MNTIKVDRKDFISKLASIKDDNIAIADVSIDRKKLLAALRLQNQEDIVTLTYGNVAWAWDKKETGEVNEHCIQFSCNHTVMRFLNRPKHPGNNSHYTPTIKQLGFIDHQSEQPKQELTGIPVDTQELIEALNFVIHGVAVEESRPVLNCVCFNCSKNKIELAAADGFRLSVTSITAKGMTKKQALIHRNDIPKLLSFLKSNITGKGKSKTWLDTYIDIRQSKIMFMSDKGMVEFANQTGSYPDYTRLIPDKGYHIQVVASDMLEAVKALNVVAKESSGIIKMKFDRYPDRITLSAKESYEDNETQTDCPALVDRECYIAANAKYLIDFLSTCKDRTIDLFVQSPSHPMVLCDDTRLEVIMPMYVQW